MAMPGGRARTSRTSATGARSSPRKQRRSAGQLGLGVSGLSRHDKSISSQWLIVIHLRIGDGVEGGAYGAAFEEVRAGSC
jgi:hypothetical protein